MVSCSCSCSCCWCHVDILASTGGRRQKLNALWHKFDRFPGPGPTRVRARQFARQIFVRFLFDFFPGRHFDPFNEPRPRSGSVAQLTVKHYVRRNISLNCETESLSSPAFRISRELFTFLILLCSCRGRGANALLSDCTERNILPVSRQKYKNTNMS